MGHIELDATLAHDRNIESQESQGSACELTILIPCLNEAETLETCINKAKAFLTSAGVRGEVLVADNGSTDGSRDIARRAGARVVPIPTRGYGAALIGGIAAARGKYAIMGDADDSYDFSALQPFVDKLRDGYDLVMGNRFAGGIAEGAMPFLHKYLGNPVLSFLGRIFFEVPVSDFHCGLRGFNVESIRRLGLQTTGMEFASEMVVKCSLGKYRITEVPTTLKPDGRSRAPHLRTWRDGWRHLKFLLIYSPKWLFIHPGLILSAFGLVMASVLMFGPVSLAPGLVLDFNSFVAACFLVVAGVQLLTFGALARYHATITGFLPRGPRSDRLVRFATTDRLTGIAGGLLLFGIVLFGIAVREWAKVDFGNLSDPLVPRAMVASVSVIVTAIQLGFSGFMFGLFEMSQRRITKCPDGDLLDQLGRD